MRVKGEITVFLALLCASILAFISIVIESARAQGIKAQIEMLMDADLHSCFGEYNIELFDRYDLMYIDTAYHGGKGGKEALSEHLYDYACENCDINGTGTLYGLSPDRCELKAELLATDHNGHAYRNQAADYIKNYSVKSPGVSMSDAEEIKGKDQNGIEDDLSGLMSQVGAFSVSFDNPASAVPIGGDIIETVMDEGVFNVISYSDLPSKRNLVKGREGNISFYEAANAKDLFDSYIFEKFSDFTEIRDKSVLNCEIEYMLYGHDDDRDNLDEAVQRIFKIRQSDNLRAIRSDSGKIDEAKALAEELTLIFGIPELTELVAKMLVYAWAYAEAYIDVSTLLNDGRIKVSKASGDIVLPLEKLMEYRSYMGRHGGNGASYKDYLYSFITEEEENLKIMRSLDVIEMNLKLSNSSFKVDGLIEYAEAYEIFRSSFGYEYNITRDYSYDRRYRIN